MAVASPCLGICHINIRSGLCAGCFRTREEIAAWPNLADEQRQQLMLALPWRAAEAESTVASE